MAGCISIPKRPPKSPLVQAREICIKRGLKPGTEAYSACLLFQEEAITEEDFQRRLLHREAGTGQKHEKGVFKK
jgi:hypothetical protein